MIVNLCDQGEVFQISYFSFVVVVFVQGWGGFVVCIFEINKKIGGLKKKIKKNQDFYYIVFEYLFKLQVVIINVGENVIVVLKGKEECF